MPLRESTCVTVASRPSPIWTRVPLTGLNGSVGFGFPSCICSGDSASTARPWFSGCWASRILAAICAPNSSALAVSPAASAFFCSAYRSSVAFIASATGLVTTCNSLTWFGSPGLPVWIPYWSALTPLLVIFSLDTTGNWLSIDCWTAGTSAGVGTDTRAPRWSMLVSGGLPRSSLFSTDSGDLTRIPSTCAPGTGSTAVCAISARTGFCS